MVAPSSRQDSEAWSRPLADPVLEAFAVALAEGWPIGRAYGVAVGRVRLTKRGREELAYLGEDGRVAFRADGAALRDTVREARVLAAGLPDEEHSGREWFGVRREGFPRIVRIEVSARVTWC